MSRVGHCIDNCPVEGFWGIVKTEMYSLNKFSSGGELRLAIDQYVHFYNYERFQKRFGVRTPMEVRTAALHAKIPEQFPIPRTNGFRNTKQNSRHKKMPQIPC
ncbi:integrase catalytic region [Dialister sp. CAG:486]|nr:integrase catalytic region [Dialister sp. CAG:486]